MLAKAKKWFAPPEFDDREKNRQGRVLRIILLASLITTVFVALIMLFLGYKPAFIVSIGTLIALLGAVWFMRRGYIGPSSLILLTSLLIMLIILPHIGDGIHDTALVAYPTVIIGASLLLNRRLFTVFVCLLIISVAIIAYDEVATGLINANFPAAVVLRDAIIIIIIILITAVPVRILNDSLFEALTTAQDNEKTLAEANRQLAHQSEALHNSRQQLRLALSAARMGIWDWDITANLISWSDNVEPMFGLEPGQFKGAMEDYQALIYPADWDMVQSAVSAALKGEASYYHVQHRVSWPDNSIHWLEGRGMVHFNAQNQPVRMVGTVADITEQKAIAEALRQSDERYRAFIAQSAEGITRYVLDPPMPINLPEEEQINYFFEHCYLAECNDAYAQMYGYPQAKALIGSRFGIRFPRTDPKNIEYLQKFIRSAYQFRDKESHELDSAGNDRYFSNNLVGIVEGDKLLHIWGVQRDITDRKKAAQQLEIYARSLERSNQELQSFAYAASHDLREPLRKIQAFGNRLQSKHSAQLDKAGHNYLQRMQNAAGRMETLIQDLLALSRVTTEAQPFVSVNLQQVVQDVLVDLELQIERVQGSVKTSELPTLMADPTQMRQLFQNLISNGLKFHRSETPPEVSIEGQLLSEQIEAPKYCQITVKDNGIGFDEQYAERIFETFQRLHGRNDYEGTGVGLAICRRIVERHGGQIRAFSKPNQGAIFVITLPIGKGEAWN